MKKNAESSVWFLTAAILLFCLCCCMLKVRPDHLTGAAFCHQIPARSPAFGFPFCYRCSGLFFGLFFGILTSCLIKTERKLFSVQILTAFAASIIIYILDILNSAKFPGFQIYPESVSYRFLSAYPLGYFTAQLIASIIKTILLPKPGNKGINFLFNIPILIVTAGISWVMIFNENHFLSVISRIFLGCTAIFFLGSLYAILLKCYALWRERPKDNKDLIISGLTCSLFHITLTGYLHLRFLPFDQIL